MTRYYLHIRDGAVFIEDFEGEEYSNVEAARADAVVAARQMMAEKVKQGDILNGQVIEIWNEAGVCVAEVTFADQLVGRKPAD